MQEDEGILAGEGDAEVGGEIGAGLGRRLQWRGERYLEGLVLLLEFEVFLVGRNLAFGFDCLH